jgi:hypothetical protein
MQDGSLVRTAGITSPLPPHPPHRRRQQPAPTTPARRFPARLPTYRCSAGPAWRRIRNNRSGRWSWRADGSALNNRNEYCRPSAQPHAGAGMPRVTSGSADPGTGQGYCAHLPGSCTTAQIRNVRRISCCLPCSGPWKKWACQTMTCSTIFRQCSVARQLTCSYIFHGH